MSATPVSRETKKQKLVSLVADYIEAKNQNPDICQSSFAKTRGISQSVISRAYSNYRKEALEFLAKKHPGKSFEAPLQKRRLRNGQVSKAALYFSQKGLEVAPNSPNPPQKKKPSRQRMRFSSEDRLEVVAACLEELENSSTSKVALAKSWGLTPNTLRTWLHRYSEEAKKFSQEKPAKPEPEPQEIAIAITPPLSSTSTSSDCKKKSSDKPFKKRLLILGGMHYNIPRWLTKNFEIHQFEQCHNHVNRIRNTLARNPPDALIVIARAVSHSVSLPIMKEAKKFKIPCLSAETGMCSILPEAQRMKLNWLLEAAEQRNLTTV